MKARSKFIVATLFASSAAAVAQAGPTVVLVAQERTVFARADQSYTPDPGEVPPIESTLNDSDAASGFAPANLIAEAFIPNVPGDSFGTVGRVTQTSSLASDAFSASGETFTYGASYDSFGTARTRFAVTFDLSTPASYALDTEVRLTAGNRQDVSPGRVTLGPTDGAPLFDQTLTYNAFEGDLLFAITSDAGTLQPGRYTFTFGISTTSEPTGGQSYAASLTFADAPPVAVPLPAAFGPAAGVLAVGLARRLRRA